MLIGREVETRVIVVSQSVVGEEIVDAEVKALCDMARHKNVTVKVSAFYAFGKKKSPYHDLSPMIKRIYEAFGPQRLMWATDCPYQVVDGHNYKGSKVQFAARSP